jgi:hypothetical protein
MIFDDGCATYYVVAKKVYKKVSSLISLVISVAIS